MDWTTLAASLVAGAALSAPVAASAGDPMCTYTDTDGVLVVSNVSTHPACRQVRRTSSVAGLYRSPAPATGPAESRPLPAAGRPAPYLDHIRAASSKYRLPEALILAVMAVESNFDPRALSDKGAMGLMQLMPGTARDLYVSDAWDPAQNIEGGSRYLRLLANQYAGDMVRTLAAYNAGPDAVRRAGDAVPDIPETKEYVRKVVALYHAYKAGR
jgi:soluble lytic murein transglycosylase-like protein